MKSKEQGDKNHTMIINYLGENKVRIEAKIRKQFLNHVAKIQWDKVQSVYLRVSYGRQKDNYGTIQTFFNEGIYYNKHTFEQAFKAFINER